MANGLDAQVSCKSVLFSQFRESYLRSDTVRGVWFLTVSKNGRGIFTYRDEHTYAEGCLRIVEIILHSNSFLCYTMCNKTHAKDCNMVLFEGKKGILKKV